jgi:hypothetical protein
MPSDVIFCIILPHKLQKQYFVFTTTPTFILQHFYKMTTRFNQAVLALEAIETQSQSLLSLPTIIYPTTTTNVSTDISSITNHQKNQASISITGAPNTGSIITNNIPLRTNNVSTTSSENYCRQVSLTTALAIDQIVQEPLAVDANNDGNDMVCCIRNCKFRTNTNQLRVCAGQKYNCSKFIHSFCYGVLFINKHKMEPLVSNIDEETTKRTQEREDLVSTGIKMVKMVNLI